MFVKQLAREAQLTTETTAAGALAALQSGADLALIVRPLAVDQIIHVTDLGQLLPAGSTAFTPPTLPMVAHIIDRDEDLV